MIEMITSTGKKYYKTEDRFEIDVYEGRATNYRGDKVEWRKHEREFDSKRIELEEKGFLHIPVRKVSTYYKGMIRVTTFEELKNVYSIIFNKREDNNLRISLFKKYKEKYEIFENDKILDEFLARDLDDIVDEYDELLRKKAIKEYNTRKKSREGKIKGGKATKKVSQKVFEETEFLRKHRVRNSELDLVNKTIADLKNAGKY